MHDEVRSNARLVRTMRSMRRAAFLFVVSCHSQPNTETRAQPQPLPAPQGTAPLRVCEPTISCGAWSPCRWLELDGADAGHEVFRVVGSDAGGYGSRYWRSHQCWPTDGGKNQCALYCDATGACVDGFTADGVCTVSHPPTPSPYVCEVRGADCVTR